MGNCRINERFIDPHLTLVIVEDVEYGASKTTTGGFMFARIAPIAVVIRRQDEITAFDMQARAVSVKQLRQDIPELNAALSRLRQVSSPDDNSKAKL